MLLGSLPPPPRLAVAPLRRAAPRVGRLDQGPSAPGAGALVSAPRRVSARDRVCIARRDALALLEDRLLDNSSCAACTSSAGATRRRSGTRGRRLELPEAVPASRPTRDRRQVGRVHRLQPTAHSAAARRSRGLPVGVLFLLEREPASREKREDSRSGRRGSSARGQQLGLLLGACPLAPACRPPGRAGRGGGGRTSVVGHIADTARDGTGPPPRAGENFASRRSAARLVTSCSSASAWRRCASAKATRGPRRSEQDALAARQLGRSGW